jgi:hypothetical protein
MLAGLKRDIGLPFAERILAEVLAERCCGPSLAVLSGDRDVRDAIAAVEGDTAQAEVAIRRNRRAIGYLPRSASSAPLSGSPAFAVRDAAASSCTSERIGPNGPNLCCSALKLSA